MDVLPRLMVKRVETSPIQTGTLNGDDHAVLLQLQVEFRERELRRLVGEFIRHPDSALVTPGLWP